MLTSVRIYSEFYVTTLKYILSQMRVFDWKQEVHKLTLDKQQKTDGQMLDFKDE